MTWGIIAPWVIVGSLLGSPSCSEIPITIKIKSDPDELIKKYPVIRNLPEEHSVLVRGPDLDPGPAD